MKAIQLKCPHGRQHVFPCEDISPNGRPINPELPIGFDDTANELRGGRSLAWWNIPFIVVYRDTDPDFLKAWPAGIRYDVRCLDGGAWDRSTWWGSFATLAEADACPSWRVALNLAPEPPPQ